jgi:hypothetical protein
MPRVQVPRRVLQPAVDGADIALHMRTLGFRTHVLLAFAAAGGLIATLARPWYGVAPPVVVEDSKQIGDLHGPVEGMAAAVGRWVGGSAGTTGWDALGTWGTVLASLAALTALGALGCLVPAIQGVAREAARYGGLACFALIAWKLLDSPGESAEPRYGALAAVVAALVALVSGAAVAAAPLQRRS